MKAKQQQQSNEENHNIWINTLDGHLCMRLRGWITISSVCLVLLRSPPVAGAAPNIYIKCLIHTLNTFIHLFVFMQWISPGSAHTLFHSFWNFATFLFYARVCVFVYACVKASAEFVDKYTRNGVRSKQLFWISLFRSVSVRLVPIGQTNK